MVVLAAVVDPHPATVSETYVLEGFVVLDLVAHQLQHREAFPQGHRLRIGLE